ncbi:MULTISPECIES: GspH/FimT family pseudopilin [Cobetia]|uniref:Type II secretion system protein H n=1 Tax=Cobetia crustatorum TaxID=553385 RepID=A0A558HF10_9GAMM|nr:MULTISPECIES: GspH/FimT family protein [Cobetia]TVU67648.1 prepilin-type N-terminal cleavage/methylation domain-containing protein [Cobetia crustatorum]
MRHSRGFTLIELVVTVAIIAIIATWAVPAWQGMVQRSQVESDVRALTHALGMARSTSTTRGLPVSVCPYAPSVATPNPTDCDGDWSNGWVVYVGSAASFALDDRLWIHQGSNAVAQSGGAARITYNDRGTLTSGNSTLVFCAAADATSVVVAPSGRVRLETGGDCS